MKLNKAKYQFIEKTNKIDKPHVRLLAKRNVPKLLNIRNENMYNTAEVVDIKYIKNRCKQISANIFENMDESNVSLEK